VIGVMAPKGQQLIVNDGLHDDMIVVPFGAGRRVFGLGDRIEVIMVGPHRIDEIPAMNEGIRRVILPRHRITEGDDEAVTVISMRYFMDPIITIALGLQVLLGVVGTLTLAMAAVGVANMMVAVVTQRRGELGVRRACGARRADLMLQLVLETAAVVLAGGLVGVGTGVALSLGVDALPLPDAVPTPHVSANVLLTTFLVLVAVGFAAGVAPARSAARVDPSAALRSV